VTSQLHPQWVVSHTWSIVTSPTRHLLDKHIPVVNALHTYFGGFWGT